MSYMTTLIVVYINSCRNGRKEEREEEKEGEGNLEAARRGGRRLVRRSRHYLLGRGDEGNKPRRIYIFPIKHSIMRGGREKGGGRWRGRWRKA